MLAVIFLYATIRRQMSQDVINRFGFFGCANRLRDFIRRERRTGLVFQRIEYSMLRFENARGGFFTGLDAWLMIRIHVH